MKTANQNTLASSFVVLVILFTGMVMAAGGPRSFATPEDGAKALVAALRAGDKSELSNILGPDGADIFKSGDETQYRNSLKAFVAAYDSHWAIARDGVSIAMLNVGKGDRLMSIPLVRNAAGWHFDATAEKREIFTPSPGDVPAK